MEDSEFSGQRIGMETLKNGRTQGLSLRGRPVSRKKWQWVMGRRNRQNGCNSIDVTDSLV
jgi:hypothetical protein